MCGGAEGRGEPIAARDCHQPPALLSYVMRHWAWGGSVGLELSVELGCLKLHPGRHTHRLLLQLESAPAQPRGGNLSV